MYRDPPSASLMRRIGLSFLLGFALFGLGALVNALLERSHVGGLMLYIDDVLLGLIAGLLVFFTNRDGTGRLWTKSV
jgi:AAA+ ATPase superfamily predicted ATPase